MSQQFASEPGIPLEEEYIDDREPEAIDENPFQSSDVLGRIWDQAQSFLVLDKTVAQSQGVHDRQLWANVTIRIHNTAPNSPDWPWVCFKSVNFDVPGIQWEWQGSRQRGPRSFGELAPGQVHEIGLTFPWNQLMSVTFVVSGQIDTDRLLDFRQVTGLPTEVVTPLQQDFAAQLSAIEINQFVGSAIAIFGALSPTMPLADVVNVREAVHDFSARIDDKQIRLDQLLGMFHLGPGTAMGTRIQDLSQALRDFQSKISDLDVAIGDTDLQRIGEAVDELKQIQLSLQRVEDAIQSMTYND